MIRSSRRAGGLLLWVALTAVLTACGGGFASNAPAAPDTTLHRYVALGDGFTAAPYTGSTQGDDGCLRSDANYPALAAQKLGISGLKDVSCTGATTNALTKKGRPPGGGSSLAPQLDAVNRDTDLVTIGMGIEDGDVLNGMFRMCLLEPCAPGTVRYTTVLGDVDGAVQAVTDALREIQTKAPSAYVVVVGYPRLTPPLDEQCGDFPRQHVPDNNVDPINYVLDDLNGKLQSAARQTGAGFIDMASLSADHVLCTSAAWVHGMRAKAGKAVAYHPVAAEQRAVADQLVTEVRTR